MQNNANVIPPTLMELAAAVAEMRKAQKTAAKTQLITAKTWSKVAETTVDALLDLLLPPEQTGLDL